VELKKLNRNALEVQQTLKTKAAIAGEKNKEELADLNVSQMDKGLLSTGSKIVPDYSPGYAAFKGFSTPNLKLEGDFHSGVFVERKGDRLLFDSKDSKTGKLEDKYTSDIFGIAPNNEQEWADEIEPDYFTDIENTLEKGIL
jgi:hypothetical protein